MANVRTSVANTSRAAMLNHFSYLNARAKSVCGTVTPFMIYDVVRDPICTVGIRGARS